MIAFPCPKCRFTLKAPEEKVGARTKCPKCGCPVQVPGRPVSTPPVVPEVLPVEGQAAAVPRQWYYSRDGQRFGPLAEGEVNQAIGRGELRPHDHVWRQGLPDWDAASRHFAFPPALGAVRFRPGARRSAGSRGAASKDDEIPDALPVDDVPTVEEENTPRRRRRETRREMTRRRPCRAAPSASGNRVQYYTAPLLDMPDLGDYLLDWLEREDFITQTLRTEDGGTLIQIEKRGSWRKFVGMSTALNIVLHLEGEELCVEVGAGQWVDKAAAGVVSLFILWPLAVTATIGAWDQMKMPERIFDLVSDYVH